MNAATESNFTKIKKLLPHQAPFLLVDDVVEPVQSDFIRTKLSLTKDMPIFAAHFPGNPIFPGVYLIEFAAQSIALLTSWFADSTKLKNVEYKNIERLLLSIEKFRFYQKAVPGDILIAEVKLQHSALEMHDATIKISKEQDNILIARGKIIVR